MANEAVIEEQNYTLFIKKSYTLFNQSLNRNENKIKTFLILVYFVEIESFLLKVL